jgi:hypothetical protein
MSLNAHGLFQRQSPAFFGCIKGLAREADAARRSVT